MTKRYNPSLIEKKWQAYWSKHDTFRAKDKSKHPKKYVLVEFPYPSGEGLHMGHLRPYVAGDVYSRYNRLQGFETMFPMGWDAFGLPAENYAIKNKIHPSVSTAKNIKNAKRQLQSWGLGFDWSREINTTDPNYYKWTQWIFLQFYKAGLAYEATGLINWCPKDKTGLADEEVIDGRCERCGSIVEKKELRQWYLKITAYAEKLLEGLKHLPKWPEAVKLQQENWIGKSEGITFKLKIKDLNISVEAYDSVPQTHMAQTFAVIAPEHPLVKKLVQGTEYEKPVIEFVDQLIKKRAANKFKLDSEPEGIFTGRYIDNPFGTGDLPLWIASFVVADYGSGIVTCSVHDERDFAFAKKYNIPLRPVMFPDDPVLAQQVRNLEFPYHHEPEAILEAPQQFKGRKWGEAREDIINYLVAKGLGYRTVQYKLRDWVFSRQRYWGEPIPLIHCENCAKKKPKVLLIHGLSGHSEENWFPWFKQHLEAKGYEVVIPDLSNNQPPTLEEWLKELAKLGINKQDRLFVVGHSLGGRTATHFILRNNFKVEKLILVAPTGENQGQKNWQNLRDAGVEQNFIDSITEFTKAKIDFKKLSGLVAQTKLYLSDNDPFIPLSIEENYKNLNPDVTVFKNKGHFSKRYGITEFPEILKEFPTVLNSGVIPVPEKDLPVKLPPVKNYEPTGTGESPLAAIKSWVNVRCPVCKGPAKRETNTMPQWAGSSWYYLRYTDPKNKKQFARQELQKHWLPVDIYFGGMEHTTLHLLYSRFWNLFLHDQGLVPVPEPYEQRVPHGIVLAADGEKMSKSRGNVVNPDDIVKKFGADTLRMYELFLGPHGSQVYWNDQGIVGVRRFLDRVWLWSQKDLAKVSSPEVKRQLNWLTKKIGEDIEQFQFNTAVSAFMQFHNAVKDEAISRADMFSFLTLLYPFTPHISEEIYQQLGGKKTLQLASWPEYDPALIKAEQATIIVQINGKIKDKLTVEAGANEKQVKDLAMKSNKVQAALEGKQIKKTIFVLDRLINLVV